MKLNRKLKLFIILFLVIIILIISFLMLRLNKKYAIKKPNILLITICSLRQDHLGCYGYSRHTTPRIDRLAENSTLFTNCYTHIPWTIPGITALMTGKYPIPRNTANGAVMLTDLLHSKGYINFGIVGTYVENSDFNFGFGQFFGPRNLETSKDENTVSGEIIANKAIEILAGEEAKNNPIFIWTLFKDPHWPYLPPEPYRGLFVNDALYYDQIQQLKINDDKYDSLGGIGAARLKDSSHKFITNKAYYISQYDAEIFFADFNIGRIINFIKASNHFDNWLIILVADHGENLGEDEYFLDHGYKLSEGAIKTPLIIKFPGQNRKEIRNELVSVCDVYHTISDLLGLDRAAADHLDYGQSLLHDRRDWAGVLNKKRIILLNNYSRRGKYGEKIRGCIMDDYKLIWNLTNNEKKLYNLAERGRLVERYSDNQKRIADTMSKIITNFFADRDKNQPDDTEKLRSLGYVQ